MILLTENDRVNISQYTMDNESGGHLRYPRTESYMEFRNMFDNLLTQQEPWTEKEQQMIEYHYACKDPKYLKAFFEKYM